METKTKQGNSGKFWKERVMGALSDDKVYYEAQIIKIVWYYSEINKHINEVNFLKTPGKGPNLYGNLLMIKTAFLKRLFIKSNHVVTSW